MIMTRLLFLGLAACSVACSPAGKEDSVNEVTSQDARRRLSEQKRNEEFVLDEFLGYKFGEKSDKREDFVFENLKSPFRCFYRVKKSYTRNGRLYQLLFFGKNDNWGMADFCDEVPRVAELFRKKFNIDVRTVKALVVNASYDNANVGIWIEPTLGGMEMKITSKKILREERIQNALPNDKDADML